MLLSLLMPGRFLLALFLSNIDRTLTSSETSPHSAGSLRMCSPLLLLRLLALFMMSTAFGWNCQAFRLKASWRKCVSSMDTTVAPSSSVDVAATTTTVPSGRPVPGPAAADGKRSDERRLVNQFVVENADLQPKSVVASGNGLFFAQNMMYRHNVMVFDRDGQVVATIPDTVNLADYGVAGGVTAKGSPVEALGMALRGRGRLLLVLDNLEQVVAVAAETVAAWLKDEINY